MVNAFESAASCVVVELTDHLHARITCPDLEGGVIAPHPGRVKRETYLCRNEI